MKIVKSKRYLTNFRALALSLAALVATTGTAFASGGWDDCADMDCNSFFAPDVIENNMEVPFFRSTHTFYQGINRDQGNLKLININEWNSFFHESIHKDLLTFLVYKMEAKDLNNLTKVMQGQEAPLTQEGMALKAAFEAMGEKEKALKTLQYLSFAKDVEPIATRRLGSDSWETLASPDAAADMKEAQRLVDLSEGLIKGTDSFLAERYRYQVIRLFYYTGKYAEAEKYFETYKNEFSRDQSPKYRFMGAAAGSYYKEKKYGKANYLYSIIFDNFYGMKQSAFFSFHPKEEADWKESLQLAKNNHEKEVLWQILGVYVDGLTGMEKIFELNPGSKLLPLLLVREVNIAEENWSANRSRIREGMDSVTRGTQTDAEAVGPARLARIKAITDSGKAYKTYLWQLGLAHLYAMTGDIKQSEQYVRLALDSMPDSKLVRAQARMTLLFAKIRGMKAVDKGMEQYLAKELTWLKRYKNQTRFRATSLNTWSLDVLSKLYLKNSDYVRSLLLTDNPRSPVYRNNAQINAIIAFLKDPGNEDFDQFLAKNSE